MNRHLPLPEQPKPLYFLFEKQALIELLKVIGIQIMLKK